MALAIALFKALFVRSITGVALSFGLDLDLDFEKTEASSSSTDADIGYWLYLS